MEISFRNSLVPFLQKLRSESVPVIALEQTNHSKSLFDYEFPKRKCALVLGNERTGVSQDVLDICDDFVEIPVFEKPYSFNVASATAMLFYEYARSQVKC